jgi:hypothetical protein
MRRSFIRKFDELSREAAQSRVDYNQKVAFLESELKKSSQMNDNFLKQFK